MNRMFGLFCGAAALCLAAAAFIPAAAQTEGPSLVQNEPPAAPSETIIVLDPGHGGGDFGVRDGGELAEKDLMLGLAVRLKEKFEVNLGAKVILTRSGDYEVTPLERAAIADHNKAGVFISLHLGASASQSADGFIAFYADPRPVRDGGGALRHPLWRHWQEQHEPFREAGRELARAVQNALAAWLAREEAEPVGADLFVLKGVACPAALLELGSLTNPERARGYGDKAFFDDLSQVLYQAVTGYLAGSHG